ncbi:unnamed protein product, partial [Laminaria digitata]
ALSAALIWPSALACLLATRLIYFSKLAFVNFATLPFATLPERRARRINSGLFTARCTIGNAHFAAQSTSRLLQCRVVLLSYLVVGSDIENDLFLPAVFIAWLFIRPGKRSAWYCVSKWWELDPSYRA